MKKKIGWETPYLRTNIFRRYEVSNVISEKNLGVLLCKRVEEKTKKGIFQEQQDAGD